ncbi:MAG: endolytic transglycosylase MltG [Prolixibacteraceae bacterium]|nr:endolytic transglycosylase MltG [Prolixibacteraceae bacterium]
MQLKQKSRIHKFPKVGKYITIVFAAVFVVTCLYAWQLFGYIFNDNVKTDYIIYIAQDADYQAVFQDLIENDALHNVKAFKWVAKKKEYEKYVKPGRYHLKQGMNTNEIVNMLRGGIQEPVDVTFNNIRFPHQLAGAVSKYLRTDSLDFIVLFNPQTAGEYGFTEETFMAMFIPNTYEFYWTTSAREFADRMKKEYDRFWNDDRKTKARMAGLTECEVATLASIVQEETNKNDEKQRVAGVYINRLKKRMPLQADPTIKFALGDFSIKRVLTAHLEMDSPYNTYLYAGLPPGPITFPEISSLEAVLNFENHNYLYFCAKEDFSGYHNFARTLAEHNRNANKYRQALNERNIFR